MGEGKDVANPERVELRPLPAYERLDREDGPLRVDDRLEVGLDRAVGERPTELVELPPTFVDRLV